MGIQGKQNQPAAPTLVGSADMDLSTRINYLNNLYDQGTIDDKEYAERSAALQIIAQVVEACISGDADTVENLLSSNPQIDVNMIRENQSTALHLAGETVITGRAEPRLLEVLLKHGAEVNARRRGETVLHSVCDRARSPVAQECVRILLKYRADVNAAPVLREGEEGSLKSSLGLAVENGASLETIRLLCQAGASPNSQTSDGPVLNYCIVNDLADEAELLLQHGADPSSREVQQGATCLASAIAAGNDKLVKLLVQRGADRNAHIMNGQSATPKMLVESMRGTDDRFVRAVESLF